jgi:hypothetical protein
MSEPRKGFFFLFQVETEDFRQYMARPVSSVSPPSWNQNLNPLPRSLCHSPLLLQGRSDFHLSSACNCLAAILNLCPDASRTSF